MNEQTTIVAILNVLTLALFVVLSFLTRGQTNKKVGEKVGEVVNQAVEGFKNQVITAATQAPPEMREMKTTVDQLAGSISTITQMASLNISHLTQELQETKRKAATLEETVSKYTGEIDKLLKSQSELTQKVQQMERQQNDTASALQTTQNELTETRKQIEDYRLTIARLEAELTNERAEKARIIQERDEAVAKVAALEVRVKELERQVHDLQVQLNGEDTATISDPLAKSPLSLGHTPPKGTTVPPFSTAVIDTTGNVISSGEIAPKDVPQ